MSERTVGTCGNCGGAVTVPTVFMSVVPPVPCCKRCGAVPKQVHGPVVEMEPRRDRVSIEVSPYDVSRGRVTWRR